MFEHESRPAGSNDRSRVDSLLELLGELSPREPSAALRGQLGRMASARLQCKSAGIGRARGISPSRTWLKPALASILLVAMGLSAWVAVHFQHKHRATERTANVHLPAVPETNKIRPASASPPAVAGAAKVRHPRPQRVPTSATRQMTIELPYSNHAIATGTNTIVQVSMSQSELLSLGFPLSATVQDRRIVAELMLGDDGLPRAISLPLPLEVMKEKQ